MRDARSDVDRRLTSSISGVAAVILAAALVAGCGKSPAASDPVAEKAAAPIAAPAPAATAVAPSPPPAEEVAEPTERPRPTDAAVFQPWNGDLDGIVQRRALRALVVYNKTNYFIDNGQPRGVAYDALQAFEEAVNKQRKLGKLALKVVYLPVSRDRLLADLAAGKGDIAIGGITVTDERRKTVDFTDPVFRDSSEIVVTGPGAPAIAAIDDLAGQEVFVRQGGSKHESLLALNERFRREGKPEIAVRIAPNELEDEDVLEMTNAGLMPIVIVDRPIAELWSQILPAIAVHPDVAVRTHADFAWAIRKNTPQLKAELDAFIAKNGKGSAFGNQVLQRYLKSLKFVKDSATPAELEKYNRLREIFQRYGERYDMDWLLMAAQGYQESRLDQEVRSQVGAIGVMQVMPDTGKEMKVGDVREVEANIHAGVKYMRFMMDRYYKDEPMKRLDKALFTFASYNAGPGRMRGLRKLAAARGLDPNVWFNNVERIAAEKIGHETVTYVSNIYKYYIGYKLIAEQRAERDKARQTVATGASAPPRR